MRFLYGLIVAGVVVVTANLVMVWIAVQTSPELEPSYLSEPR